MHFENILPRVGLWTAFVPGVLGARVSARTARFGGGVEPSSLEMRQSGAPYQTRILETATTFTEESNGVWQLIDCDGDGIPDLVYIKTQNTGTGRVEVHIASAASNFQTRIWESGTTFSPENDGTWLMIPSSTGAKADLAFIKTADASSNTVEVHIASGASGYQTRVQELPSTFAEESDGTWSLYDFDGDGILDLIFIKTSNTGTNSVEVHVASGASEYRNRIYETGSGFGEESDGLWSIAPYQAGVPDLTFIKTSNTGTGTVEVHVASRSSDYETRLLDVGSTFAEENNGFWSLVDFNRDGLLDLIYIKTQNTGSGKVEVHVASGK